MIPLDTTDDDRADAMLEASRDLHSSVVPHAPDIQLAFQVHDLMVAGSMYVRKGRLTAWEVVETIALIDRRWAHFVCSLILERLDENESGWTTLGLARQYGVV